MLRANRGVRRSSPGKGLLKLRRRRFMWSKGVRANCQGKRRAVARAPVSHTASWSVALIPPTSAVPSPVADVPVISASTNSSSRVGSHSFATIVHFG